MAESNDARQSTAKTMGLSGSRPIAQSAADGPEWPHYEPSLLRELLHFLAPVRNQFWTIVIVAFMATIAGDVASHLLLAKWYRAEAILKPMTTQQTIGLMHGVMLGGGGTPWSAFMGSQYNSSAAEEDITILESYSFLTGLAREHHMDAELLNHVKLSSDADKSWTVYRILRRRFSNKYSLRTGNLTVTYLDRNRDRAAQVLEWEITDLRQILRAREVNNASSAAASLEQQVKAVSDTLLARQIYELIAKQIQREKLAEVQADFAFEVLQPPVASDRPALPHNALNGLLLGFLTFIGLSAVILIRDRRVARRPRKRDAESTSHTDWP